MDETGYLKLIESVRRKAQQAEIVSLCDEALVRLQKTNMASRRETDETKNGKSLKSHETETKDETEESQPWVVAGVSKATWYRQQKKVEIG